MELKDRIRLMRLDAGFSQQDLSQLAGLTVGSISKLERGITTNPDWVTMVKIAKALETTTAAFEEEAP